MNLAGRTVLLTGATGGLGHAIARRLRAAGAELVITGRRAEVLEPLAAETGARSLAVDLADAEAVQRLASDCADVDVLVSNAGLPGIGPADLVQRRGARSGAGGQPARPDGARARARRGAWSRAAAATSSSCPRWPARSAPRARRSTARRSSACAGSRRACARTCARAASASARSSRASCATRACSTTPGPSCRRASGPCRRRTSPTRSCARSSAIAARSTSRRSGCARVPRRPAWPPTSRRRCSASSAGSGSPRTTSSAQKTKR